MLNLCRDELNFGMSGLQGAINKLFDTLSIW